MAKKLKNKKFHAIELPLINEELEILAYLLEDLQDKTVKIDMTRRLRGKALDLIFKINIKDEKAIGIPKKLKLMPFFIQHMLRKRISYIEDSFQAETKDSIITIKPFLITRKKVSRAVKKTLRNSAKNWILDYTKTKTDEELFEEILFGKLQKPLSLKLKKIYPLSLCEIRILEINKPLEKPVKKPEEKTKQEKTNTKEKKDSKKKEK